MRLISLTCDQPTFHNIYFNPKGLSIIIGDSSQKNDKKENEGSSNGVGKTLTLGLVHHCLGANANKKLASAVPDWVFTLLLSINGKEYRITRTGDGKKITINDQKTTVKKLRESLDTSGCFLISPDVPLISFRSLFKRFARYERSDCLDPIKTTKEPDFDARLRTFYLLGLDCSLVLSKQSSKHELDKIKDAIQNWQTDNVLKDMFRAGSQPKLRAEWLLSEIPRLQKDLEEFQIAENYSILEQSASSLTAELRNIEKEHAILLFKLDNIESTLKEQPDISKNDLLELYSGLQSVFKPEALAHFTVVEKFHNSLSINRKNKLENDKLSIASKIKNLRKARETLSSQRDSIILSLQGKKALDEYASIANHLASLEEEYTRINEFLNFSDNLNQRSQHIRESRVEEDRIAANYTSTTPLRYLDQNFRDYAKVMYPRAPSGIILDVNTGDNQLRYDLTIQIEGDDSDGINAARIIGYDWLIFNHGSNHSMSTLWHDNRLFADIDPKVRAHWFEYSLSSLAVSDKQYIVSLNTENYQAMKEFLTPEQVETLTNSIVLTLTGDSVKNKLLGIQFGSLSK